MINVDHIQKKYLLSDLYLRQPIQKIQLERKGVQQAFITRAIAFLATSFFQAIDFLYNFCMAVGKLPLAALKNMGVKQLDSKEFSFTSIGQHFALAGKCLLGTITGSIGGVIAPSYISFLCRNKSILTGEVGFIKETLPEFPVKKIRAFANEIENKYRSTVHALPKSLKIDHSKIATDLLTTEATTPGQNLHLDKIFGHRYLISLEKCADKRATFFQRMQEIGLSQDKFELVNATYGKHVYSVEERKRMKDNSFGLDPTTKEGQEELDKQHAGQMGVWKSHERVIRDAKEHYDAAMQAYKAAEARGFTSADEKRRLEANVKEYSSIVIFEDDAGFGFLNPDKKSYNINNIKQEMWQCLKELPEKWDMFNFCPMRLKPQWEQIPEYQHIHRANYSVSISTIAINASMYDVLLKKLDKINQPGVDLIAVDHIHGLLNRETFSFEPKKRPLAFQAEGVSDISGKDIDRQDKNWFQPMWNFPGHPVRSFNAHEA